MESDKDFLKAISLGKLRKGAGARLRKLIAAKELSTFSKVVCFCCAEPINHAKATAEHIIPVSLGGKTILDNLALSHKICNERRGNTPTSRKI